MSIPNLPPEQQHGIDQFHGFCIQILDRYLHGFEMDMNRHAVKHGPMDPTRAHSDLTRILSRDVPHNMLGGLLAEAILRGISTKRKGKA